MGVDAAGPYWIGVASDLRVYAERALVDLLATADADGTISVTGIDIPIGLPTGSGPRPADLLARTAVGPRRASVFMTPPRSVLQASTYDEASRAARREMGKGVSRQAWGLRLKVLEVDDVVRSSDRWIVEVHPEVSFATLAGRFLPCAKSSWAGLEDRRALLAAVGFVPSGDLGRAGKVAAPDDVLDAAVACWTAQRVAAGDAVQYPDPPQLLSGIHVAIHA